MAFPYFLITTLFLFLTLSIFPSHQTTPTISAAPALLPLPPDTPLSPDIAPLLPSPGGSSGTPGSSMPTIPSTRSQNPDMLDPVGPDTALAPFASLPESSAFKIPIKGFGSGFFAFLAVFMI
ncbi:classical arabinogalactan protein 27-like [Salvia splendens]|uniref:classical arabinogalactan protein 27-like n=1 Tax=Salvia splendens TaxID=180675 RepID=UPI001C27A3F2|nr:classical arabinogalactan protein 27-like [Salvia splendens]